MQEAARLHKDTEKQTHIDKTHSDTNTQQHKETMTQKRNRLKNHRPLFYPFIKKLKTFFWQSKTGEVNNGEKKNR